VETLSLALLYINSSLQEGYLFLQTVELAKILITWKIFSGYAFLPFISAIIEDIKVVRR
jgi:hypothetical protein